MDQRGKSELQQAQYGLRLSEAEHARVESPFERAEASQRETLQERGHARHGQSHQERGRVRGVDQKTTDRVEGPLHSRVDDRRPREGQDRGVDQSVRVDQPRLGQHLQDAAPWRVRQARLCQQAVASRRCRVQGGVRRRVEGVVDRAEWRTAIACCALAHLVVAPLQARAFVHPGRGRCRSRYVSYAEYWSHDKEIL